MRSLWGSRKSGAAFPSTLKESVRKHNALWPSVAAERRTGGAAPLRPAVPGRLLFPVLTREAHALRPCPRRAEGGSVVCVSSSPPPAGLLTGSDGPAGKPRRPSRPLPVRGLRGPRPRLICLCPDGGKEEKEKPQTSFGGGFAGRAWRARRGSAARGSRGRREAGVGTPGAARRPPSPPAVPGAHAAVPEPAEAETRAGRRASQAVSSRGRSGADSCEAAGAGGAPSDVASSRLGPPELSPRPVPEPHPPLQGKNFVFRLSCSPRLPSSPLPLRGWG